MVEKPDATLEAYEAVRVGAPVVGVWRLEGYYEIVFVCDTETRFVIGDILPDIATISQGEEKV
ncbi:MAG: hypothetical protein CO042_00610 [Parcubacteria group bacterium CG_4_9_14_0_2_um_filter_41_8]|nr:MAG: hypothetical protein AUJ34_00315 [Parcubacteria group bacterium CG1_02_41_12]PIP67326.1 MAG: hypothetical protein COW93_00715 [Parcubacteria group bacterium CG22_combo_CG10-13_8_21_14_all_41_9]PIQ77964.1 MAG: hypothetical protein COV79_05735 [Parcubacteria group bacterium CG11_big_fil_rev_8_21_14_0_20_41_14]PJC41024.1 MAG: hypothetical protein CO042_00610 [Parcubacteria group bacterium CG_4_9_14_0_2_um_filter_41_8]